jgi:Polyketide cyclase / dehydrase and lipid transport
VAISVNVPQDVCSVRAVASSAWFSASQVWEALRSPSAFVSTAKHVVSVRPQPGGGDAWVVLSGGKVRWIQHDEPANDAMEFWMVDGDLEGFRGRWEARDEGGSTVVSLTMDFWLGVDGLAPLLNPVWTTLMQSHVTGLVHVFAGRPAAEPAR